MDPNKICDVLLTYIKNSKLNFNLSETPFAVSINLKKSFIRDRNGAPKYPTSVFSDTSIQNVLDENKSLKSSIDQYEIDQDSFKTAIHDLDMKLQKAKVEIEDNFCEKNRFKQAKEDYLI